MKKGFSLAELLMVMVVTGVLIMATMPVLTIKKKELGENSNSKYCVVTDLENNQTMDISQTNCTTNPNSNCCKAVDACVYDFNNSCDTLTYYADNGQTKQRDSARKALREACDRGGEKACEYFVKSCAKDGNNCNITYGNATEYDLSYYLGLSSSNTNLGRLSVQNLIPSYYLSSNPYVVTAVNNLCPCTNPSTNTACEIRGTTSCDFGIKIGGTGDDYGNDLIVDDNANVYLTGYQKSNVLSGSGSDIFIAKLNSSGTVVWQKSIAKTSSTSADEQGGGITIGNDGYLYLASSYDGYQLLITKLDLDGNILLNKVLYKSDDYFYPHAISVVNGNIYVTGNVENATNGWGDPFVSKFNNAGTLQWIKYFGNATRWEAFYGLVVDSSENVYLSGTQSATTTYGSEDMAVIKLNSAGAYQWHRRLGTTSWDVATRLALDSGGNVYIAGKQYVYGTEGLFVVAKLTNGGVVSWTKSLSFLPAYAEGEDVKIDENGNIFLLGKSYIAGQPTDTLVAKLDNSANLLWYNTYGGANDDTPSAMFLKNGFAYVVGYQSSDTYGLKDIFMLKIKDKTSSSNSGLQVNSSSVANNANAVTFSNYTGYTAGDATSVTTGDPGLSSGLLNFPGLKYP